MSASFVTTLSSGIQDISAILSLFGTEQCEMHVGSALRGSGRGGYLYAAITPVSIFGSLGTAKAAFTIMLVSTGFGARKLKDMGFEPKGDILTVAMLEKEGNRYVAESRLLQLLDNYYIRSAQNVTVHRPDLHAQRLPLHPWTRSLLMASISVAGVGFLPYLHFIVRHHFSYLPLAILFPLCRVLGGLLCVFSGQVLLQYRIERILKHRILFRGISDISRERNTKIPVQHILWDHDCTSEACLSSLYNMLLKPDEAKKAAVFFECVCAALALPTASSPEQVAKELKACLTNTWMEFSLLFALLSGFLMTLVGYIGCFTIVQGASDSLDTYIWLAAEVVLSLIRLGIWAGNPSWDDSDGIWLKLAPQRNTALPSAKPTSVIINNKRFQMFRTISETIFWQTLTAYSGPLDIGKTKMSPGIQRWYSWAKQTGAEQLGLVCIILQDQDSAFLCYTNDKEDMKFYHADLKSEYAVEKEEVKDNNELMNEETQFKMDVFEHYYFIRTTKSSDVTAANHIEASWALTNSESSVKSMELNSQGQPATLPDLEPTELNFNGRPAPLPDLEKGDSNSATPETWENLFQHTKLVQILDGTVKLGYQQFSDCRRILSKNTSSMSLHQELSELFKKHTEEIYKNALETNKTLQEYYNEQWKIYSEGITVVDRLFEPLNANLRSRHSTSKHGNTVVIDTVQNIALKQWKSNVLEKMSTTLSDGLGTEVARVSALFISGDLTKADFWNMKIKSVGDPSALQEASASGRARIVRLLLENGTDVNTVGEDHGSALQAAARKGKKEIVRLLLENGAVVNTLGGKYGNALQAASKAGHREIVRILIENGGDTNTLGGKYGSALQGASCHGHLDIVDLLLEHNADVNAAGGKYGSPLHAAVRQKHGGIVRLLVQHHADPGNMLHEASLHGRQEDVRLLLEGGVNINAVETNSDDGTALQTAARGGNLKIVRLLLEHGADVNVVAGEYGSALQGASCHGHLDIVDLLLEHSADVNAPGGKYGSPLHAAVRQKHGGIVRLLVQHHADPGNMLQEASLHGRREDVRLLLEGGVNVNAVETNSEDGTALQVATREGNMQILHLLLENGADVNIVAGEYGSALQVAAIWNRQDIVRLLLEHGANVNAQVGARYGSAINAASSLGRLETLRLLLDHDADIGDALQCASFHGEIGAVRLLLDRGADVNALGGNHGSALQAAALNNKMEILHLLLERGAKVNTGSGAHDSALQAASSHGHEDVVLLLIENGAQVNIRGSDGSALDLAIRNGHSKIAEILWGEMHRQSR
ncbi:ankyrin repeat-containing domain protein [Mycena rebaudengoi]|nr:ankyrin repeat-containing domain protein [Mycena rebaudengoi]